MSSVPASSQPSRTPAKAKKRALPLSFSRENPKTQSKAVSPQARSRATVKPDNAPSASGKPKATPQQTSTKTELPLQDIVLRVLALSSEELLAQARLVVKEFESTPQERGGKSALFDAGRSSRDETPPVRQPQLERTTSGLHADTTEQEMHVAAPSVSKASVSPCQRQPCVAATRNNQADCAASSSRSNTGRHFVKDDCGEIQQARLSQPAPAGSRHRSNVDVIDDMLDMFLGSQAPSKKHENSGNVCDARPLLNSG
mmetsp:Transcript_11859/g.22594  ORF Transcript_11859/g.22594 Transcript_11859/m.22594 type:complete len:257 (-) Transcript_11859:401-1171(-)|eukprot:CAMPEP_0114253866 /NCGR_PEP_ID=MMETSP0058-20121206/16650_1 /TAXON_ID=36894 /ORGANISM="Pyramimonas parkeae, CCMP726" /LENGTH=256 /DNA_ID=CAMNT_0001367999 /DNA_START=185 /DNA_END=955 /DNA_ORIENTATION=+